MVRVADTARPVPPAPLDFAVSVTFGGGLTSLSVCRGSMPSWWRIDKTASVEIDAANTMGKALADFFVFFFLDFISGFYHGALGRRAVGGYLQCGSTTN